MAKIIVSKIGARHRYMIPNILHKNRMLKSLFTDSYRYTILGKTSHIFLKLGSSEQLLLFEAKVTENSKIMHTSIRQTYTKLLFKKNVDNIIK